MRVKTIILTMLWTGLFCPQLFSQQLSQTIRGTITDKISKSPLIGANVIVIGSDPLLGSAADIDGNFKILKVPVGKHSLKITFLGYKELILPNVIVNSGKEVVININLEENFIQAKEVIITPKDESNKALNEMATVSARSFSVEETQKFAAAVNDPGRMASSFAGVISSDDGNNHISIRGNSPTGLLWRMEGVEIPNPNHFSIPGSAGGGISILSSQVMSNSDFLTGAFPSEFGNALSGVFDIRLRKGNNEKTEFTFQAGFLGVDAAVEGPIKKGYNGSFLINYRYSTLSVLSKMGVSVGEGSTDFQDLSYNISLPTKKAGTFSIFGFGGLSSQEYDAPKDSIKWKEDGERNNISFISNTGATGVTHSLTLGKETFLKSAVVASATNMSFKGFRLDDEYTPQLKYDESTGQQKITATTTLNHKFNSRHSFRSGFSVNSIYFNIDDKSYDQDINEVRQTILGNDKTSTMQLYAQSNYHLTPTLSFNAGLHYFQLMLNNTFSLEPRASVKYAITDNQSVGLGYGLHSQLQPMGIYFAKSNSGVLTNENLEMSKAHHFIASYDRMLTGTLHMKTEVYYQHLFNIPVRSDVSNSFSTVNIVDGYITDPLANKGTGMNYGIELTIEQFLSKNYYFLLSGSLYESKYKGSDNILRDNRFNGNYASTFTAGKEIVTGKKFKNRIIGLNIKSVLRGGFRDTPIDLTATEALPGEGVVYMEEKAFSVKYPVYFRTDIRVSVKRNRPNSTQTLALDIQNVSNRKNIYGKYYNEETKTVKAYYQTSLIPVLSYKIEF